MNSKGKGDKLEDAFYRYLIDQKDRGELIFDIHPPQNCKIYKRKKYHCRVREADVEFDVVVEVYRTGSDKPHLYLIFECKNHCANVSEIHVNDFTSKVGRIFPYASKAVLVVNSPLQSGAEAVARNYKIGIVKYDEQGFEVIAERVVSYVEREFIRSQVFKNNYMIKSLKFSAFHDGKYFSNINDFFESISCLNENSNLRVNV